VETDAALELVARHAPRDAADPHSPFRTGATLASPRLAALHFELLGLVAREAPRLEQEDALSELAQEALRCAYGSRTRRAPGSPRAREQVEAARVVLNRQVTSQPDLTALARMLDCSPFHLSRSFHAIAGVTLRRYAKRLRVRAAALRLRDGERDLTRLALELGYADHSHFTHAFREEWGVPPAAFRGRGRIGQREAGGTVPVERA
jgi:AraC-like DNA-binding protein